MAVEPGLNSLTIALKGGGDLATGIALTLYRAGFRQLYILETPEPTVIRRRAAFAQAVYEKSVRVEGVEAVFTDTRGIKSAWEKEQIPVLADPEATVLNDIPPDILVDAIMAKKNLGTHRRHAPLVMALGPGFYAGLDVDLVVETQRGHDLSRLIYKGEALANTHIPEAVLGMTHQRLVRAPVSGRFTPVLAIGETVKPGQILGHVDQKPIRAPIKGAIRGLIQKGLMVAKGQKIGDVDPREDKAYCHTCSDKARALGGAVLTAILERFND